MHIQISSIQCNVEVDTNYKQAIIILCFARPSNSIEFTPRCLAHLIEVMQRPPKGKQQHFHSGSERLTGGGGGEVGAADNASKMHPHQLVAVILVSFLPMVVPCQKLTI